MNEILPSRFLEHVERLVLGIEPVDAQRGTRIMSPIDVVLDGAPVVASSDDSVGEPDPVGGLEPIPRHASCRHALIFRPGLKGPITIRMYDRRRRYVPRRIRYPIPADIRTASPPSRVRRPALFPGAAYDVSPTATGMRGRVTWNASTDVAARWVRVVAKVGEQVVGQAHGDDRGEFLLMLDSGAGGLGELPTPIVAKVTVFGPPAPVVVPANDPFGDLPVETLVNEPDGVSAGDKLPPGYVSTADSSRSVSFRAGTLLTQQEKFFFNH